MTEILAVVGGLSAGLGVQLWAFEATWARPRVAAALRLSPPLLLHGGRVLASVLSVTGIAALGVALLGPN